MPYDEKLVNDPKGGMPRLIEVMRALRDPDTGCPWDIEQDFASIAPYTIEEAYEVADAIERQDWQDLKAELGDLLLQTVYHTQMASEEKLFDFDDVANAISDKMVARHPHVFGDESREKSADQQTADWEAIKAAERAEKAKQGTLDDVALALPALPVLVLFSFHPWSIASGATVDGRKAGNNACTWAAVQPAEHPAGKTAQPGDGFCPKRQRPYRARRLQHEEDGKSLPSWSFAALTY